MKRVVIEVTKGRDVDSLITVWAWKEVDGSTSNVPENESSLLASYHAKNVDDLRANWVVFARKLMERLDWIIEY